MWKCCIMGFHTQYKSTMMAVSHRHANSSVSSGLRVSWLFCPLLWLHQRKIWLETAALGTGPIPALRWWRRTHPPTHRVIEVRRHPRDTQTGILGHIHTVDKTGLGCFQSNGASMSCPKLPTATLLSCEVSHSHYSVIRSAFPMATSFFFFFYLFTFLVL